ncbi:MAG: YraN family protein [Pseudomonadota bacterium]
MKIHMGPDHLLETRKCDSGAMAYFAGCAAEATVARAYVDRGCDLLESRWRGQSGEIDLIFLDAGELVFVEVKKARSFDAASERLRPAQMRRIHLAASEYLDHAPDGPLSLMRFDLAVCNAAGEVDIREGAFSHF